jgi:hypothetical protein
MATSHRARSFLGAIFNFTIKERQMNRRILNVCLLLTGLLGMRGAPCSAQVMQQAVTNSAAASSGASPVAVAGSSTFFNCSSTTSCTSAAINSMPANVAWVIHVQINSGSISVTSVTDGSSGGGTADTIAQAGSCDSTNTSFTACDFYVCKTTMAAGNVTFTINTSTAATMGGVTSAYTGVLASGCLDTNITKATGATSGANPTFTSPGNVLEAYEVLEESINSGQVPTANNGWTVVKLSGGNESANRFNPTPGATVSASWSMSSGSWEGRMMALRSATP